MKLYELQPYSDIRFAQYSHVSYSNFQLSFAIIVDTLNKRTRSADTKVKKIAQQHLSDICNLSFVLCGVIDFYNAVAKLSCKVQKFDVMPWEVV